MALALYRKYRPRTFAEVVGQEHVTKPLSTALRTGRLHHAYLFSGPRGCGKTSSARILARSLNCAAGPTPDPCGECESCRALAVDGPGSVDVIEIDAASHGGVDDARDLRERAFFAPAVSRYKIYVIDEAHMVSPAGFNALLKLVEEPPEYVKFVFATTEPEKVLGTIKSRTHHYPFRLVPPAVLRPYLEELCRREQVPVEPAVFPLVVRAGGGSVRDSLSVLDQLIAGAGDEGVTYAQAAALLGVTDAALIDEVCDAIAAQDGAAAYAAIDRVVQAGHDARRFAADLLERLRDLIVLQHVPDAASKGLLDVPADQLDRMVAQAQRFGPGTLSRCADIVHNGLIEMRGTTAPRLLLELIVARMLLPEVDASASGLLHRLERMERRLGVGGPDAPPQAAPPAATVREATVPAAVREATVRQAAVPVAMAGAPPASSPPAGALRQQARIEPAVAAKDPAAAGTTGQVDAAAVRRVWDEVLAVVSRRSKKVAAFVRDATVRQVEGETLVLTFQHSFHAQALANEPELLLAALHEVLGGQWLVRCELSGDQRPVTSPATEVTSRTGAAAVAPRPPAPVPAPATMRPTLGPLNTAASVTSARRTGPASRGPESTPAAAPESDLDWPTPARPGGVDAPQLADPPAGRSSTGKRARAGKAAAARDGGQTAKRTASPAQGMGFDEIEQEPPYDPEYDGPITGPTVAYEGFDPGDEPLDEPYDERATGTPASRQSIEEQAVQLLQEAFGAEKIDEVDHR